MTTLQARWTLTRDGWRENLIVVLDRAGRITAVVDGSAAAGERPDSGDERPAPAPGVMRPVDLLVPAVPDAHCHAFQHGIAGLAEQRVEAAGEAGQDDFWSWREQMYAAVAALDGARLGRLAENLYRRLRERGYGMVAEFHYVHRLGGDGPFETACALVEAARAAGMPLLLLPVLYRQGGIDGRTLSARQQPFALTLDDYGRLLERLSVIAAAEPLVTVGVAPHSLRAVSAADLDALLAVRAALVPGCPVHIHVSEQRAEVDEARQLLGTTPIAWLLDHASVDDRWCLVHATHATAAELDAVAAARATICLCPTTEANLADGPFPIENWWSRGGAIAIGSDSNVGVDPAEELRWLEYQARLRLMRRVVLIDHRHVGLGTSLWSRAVAGGRRACGQRDDPLTVGTVAGLFAIERDDPTLTPDLALDDWLFARRATRGAPV